MIRTPKRAKFLTLILAGLFLVGARWAAAGEADRADSILVIVSVDGLAGYYLDDPQAEMPTLRALAAAGARANGMKASTPTVTWPNHTTLVTGVTPAVHGVVGNNYFDRTTRKKQTLIADPVFDKDEIVKVPTLYDVAKAHGLTTAAVRWPASRNARTLDWTTPDMKPGAAERRYVTPSLLKAAAQAGVSFGNEPRSDEWCTRLFNFIVTTHRPRLALLHIADVDHAEHAHGPRSPEAYAAIKAADAQVGKVWTVLKKDFPDRATLMVVSDHGFSPIDKVILPNVILRQAGLISDSGSNAVQVVVQGGAAMVYILDDGHRAALAKKIAAAFRTMKEVDRVVDTEHLKDFGVATPAQDPHAPDLVIFAKEGFSFGDTSAGAIPVQIKPERKGSHGHNPNFPDLHATFIAWGAGIKAGVTLGEIDNTRVAPTAAKLLHLSLPAPASAPLSEILTN